MNHQDPSWMNLNGPAISPKWFDTWCLTLCLMAYSILDGWLYAWWLTLCLMADSCRQDCLMSGGRNGTNRYWIRGIQGIHRNYSIWTKHCSALYMNSALHCTEYEQCTSLHRTSLHRTALHCTVHVHFTSLSCSSTTLHCTKLDWTAHYTCLRSPRIENFFNWGIISFLLDKISLVNCSYVMQPAECIIWYCCLFSGCISKGWYCS